MQQGQEIGYSPGKPCLYLYNLISDISGMLVHSMLKSTNIAQRVISGNEAKAATKQNGGNWNKIGQCCAYNSIYD